jgi:hypothetical protein
MKISFTNIFAFLYFLIVLLLLFSCLFNVVFEAIILIITFAIYFSINFGLLFLGERIAKRYNITIKKAGKQELRREDDILLQSVPFLSAIVFFYVNFLIEDLRFKTVLSLFIVVSAICFYLLRVWGKLKESPRHRFFSMILLAILLGSFIASFFSTPLYYFFNANESTLTFLEISLIFGGVPLSFISLFERVFSKRYGYEPTLTP